MKKLTYKLLVLLMGAAIVFYSCKKKKEDTPDDVTTKETNETQGHFDDVLKISEDAMGDSDSDMNKRRTSNTFTLSTMPCATVTIDTTYVVGPGGRITVDFGATNTFCGTDAKYRRGKIIIDYTGRYRTTGTEITTTFDNYYVNDIKVEGTRFVRNDGSNSFSIVDSDVKGGSGYAKLTHPDGTNTTWKSTRTRVWTAGSATLWMILDDEYTINGTADGTTRAGAAYTLTATNILVKIACWSNLIFYPVSGTLKVTAADGDRIVDYGDGQCDKKVKYTHTNGKTYDVTLR